MIKDFIVSMFLVTIGFLAGQLMTKHHMSAASEFACEKRIADVLDVFNRKNDGKEVVIVHRFDLPPSVTSFSRNFLIFGPPQEAYDELRKQYEKTTRFPLDSEELLEEDEQRNKS